MNTESYTSLTRLSTRLLDAKKDNPNNVLIFDKDDDDAMDFVTAASNLRSIIFKIERKSRFDVKCKLSFCVSHSSVISQH
jgi:ubiquitin-like 1-activating enzyme E1 B